MPPGRAIVWRREAMLMLSPRISFPERTTSPRWTPMRMRTGSLAGPAAAASSVWIATAACTASTALSKSATKQSPTNTSSVPPCRGTRAAKTSRMRVSAARARGSSSPMSRL